MMEEAVRELTLEEEIMMLPIKDNVKDRMIQRLKARDEHTHDLEVYLERCHSRMARMEKAIVEMAMAVAEVNR